MSTKIVVFFVMTLLFMFFYTKPHVLAFLSLLYHYSATISKDIIADEAAERETDNFTK